MRGKGQYDALPLSKGWTIPRYRSPADYLADELFYGSPFEGTGGLPQVTVPRRPRRGPARGGVGGVPQAPRPPAPAKGVPQAPRPPAGKKKPEPAAPRQVRPNPFVKEKGGALPAEALTAMLSLSRAMGGFTSPATDLTKAINDFAKRGGELVS